MPRLDSLPDPDTIKHWKGRLDFYVWRSLPVVRTWPRKYTGPRSQAILDQIASFSSYAHRVRNTDQYIIRTTIPEIAPTTWTWRDLLTSAAYGNLYE